MKALIQRVTSASVSINGEVYSAIGRGFVLFLCIVKGDSQQELEYISKKAVNLRIFDDKDGKMNLSLKDINGEALVISQFTLASDCKKGNRPSFDRAETPDKAQAMYNDFVRLLTEQGVRVSAGVFAADMQVSLINDGPVTFMLE
ncbi:D-tyrosyl-tRNA(Tyr) deacylase [Candidatus Magnetoovum chiemensis]|nr:D-tyrosyl-tRNA(Tyr) deacylase [Candidatus Magnetoovum chiemensis]